MNFNIPFLARWFGANYKTLLTGIGNTLSSILVYITLIPYTVPTELTNILSPWQKRDFLIGALIAKLILGFWNSIVQKDKDVHGGTVIQDANGKALGTLTQASVTSPTITS